VIESHDASTPPITLNVLPDSSSEEITDELSGHKKEGNCLHNRFKTQFFELDPSSPVELFQMVGIPTSPIHTTWRAGYLVYTYARPHTQILFPDVVIRDIDWGQMSYEAMTEMTPQITKGNQFVNDLLELHQIKGLISPFGKAKSLLGRYSNAYLWYMFGIAPTIKSINAVIDLMRTVRKKILDIIRRGKRLQTRHFSRRLDISDGLPNSDDEGYLFIENASDYRVTTLYRECRWEEEPRYHATMKFRYDVSQLELWEGELRAWLEAGGLLDPLSILWNATPFSFVLDWFSNIGDWIAQFGHQDVVPIVIEDFSHSVKYSYITDMIISLHGALYKAPLARGTRTYYERRRTSPQMFSKITFKWPSLIALTLGAALGGQAVSNHRKPFIKTRKRLPYLRIRDGVFVS
jgi:hypothetical protein